MRRRVLGGMLGGKIGSPRSALVRVRECLLLTYRLRFLLIALNWWRSIANLHWLNLFNTLIQFANTLGNSRHFRGEVPQHIIYFLFHVLLISIHMLHSIYIQSKKSIQFGDNFWWYLNIVLACWVFLCIRTIIIFSTFRHVIVFVYYFSQKHKNFAIALNIITIFIYFTIYKPFKLLPSQ